MGTPTRTRAPSNSAVPSASSDAEIEALVNGDSERPTLIPVPAGLLTRHDGFRPEDLEGE